MGLSSIILPYILLQIDKAADTVLLSDNFIPLVDVGKRGEY